MSMTRTSEPYDHLVRLGHHRRQFGASPRKRIEAIWRGILADRPRRATKLRTKLAKRREEREIAKRHALATQRLFADAA